MFILCEKLENDICVPILNEFGFVSQFTDELDANIERIYLQPDHKNPIVIRGSKWEI